MNSRSLLAACVLGFALLAPAQTTNTDKAIASFSRLELENAAKYAELALRRDPGDPAALFVRMETAELRQDTATVLASGLRLCRTEPDAAMAEIASGRVLAYAGNTLPFRGVLQQVKALAQQENACSPNLRLTLVAAAGDGIPDVNLDHASAAAGLLTRWRLAGPFGQYSNAGFDTKWLPEADQFSHEVYGKVATEQFLFRDGFVQLPDYLSRAGVFYASSDLDIEKQGEYKARVYGPGPYVLFLDGKAVLTHDSRYALKPTWDGVTLKLSPGKHRLMLKFTSDGTPLRVSVAKPTVSAGRIFAGGRLQTYIAGMAAYFRGDSAALQQASQASPGQLGKYLAALSSAGDAASAWEPLNGTPLGTIKLASLAADRGHAGEWKERVLELVRSHPQSEAAQQAAFQLTGDENTLQRLLELHSSCGRLVEAARYFAVRGRQAEGDKLEQQLEHCAPESLDYARMLSVAGRHMESAANLRQLLAANPLRRAARRMLIEELVLCGQEAEARAQLQQLLQVAPNARDFANWASDPAASMDSRSPRAVRFAQQEQFYAPYRRDGLKMARDTAVRNFPGGPSVILLWDKAIEFAGDGSLSVYTHRVTRLLSKDGIAMFSEVELPRGADLLELRTIKADGETIEPELTQQKPTISMPALEPGDSIEEEFVVHYSDARDASEQATRFIFGSFVAPILYARFAVIAPEDLQLRIAQDASATNANRSQGQGRMIRTWEQTNILQAFPESNLPAGNVLPSVSVALPEDTRTRLRDQLIDVAKPGFEAMAVAHTLPAGSTEVEKAARLYRFVSSKIRSVGDWNDTSAEDTLRNLEGSRATALLALARASGLKAALLLAHTSGDECGEERNFSCYNTALVRFWFADGRIVDAAPEADLLPFGALPAGCDPKDALLVPLTVQDESGPFHVALAPSMAGEKTVATADLYLGAAENLTIDLHIHLGASRAQQVRGLLRSASRRERQAFFEQVASRIFPGAAAVTGDSTHEGDPDLPLELVMRCQAPLPSASNRTFEMPQLVPGLGLRELYTRSATRKFALSIDSLFFESATFHLHLAQGMELQSVPGDFAAHNEFGDYSVRFVSARNELTIQREFRIPPQIVTPEKYTAFANFARRIDEAEQGRIVVVTVRGQR